MSPAKRSADFELVARHAQEIVADRPVVVLGSGASIPHGLPSMNELSLALLKRVPRSLPGWLEFETSLSASMDLEQALQDVTLPKETLEAIVLATWDVVSERDLAFFQSLLSDTVTFPLAGLFKHLLTTADAQLHVVTTNYDRVAEYAANVIRAVASTGATTGWLQRFYADTLTRFPQPPKGYEGNVIVLKPHGSLDWFQDSGGSFIGAPQLGHVPKNLRPLIVTPGVSKFEGVLQTPFRQVVPAVDEVLGNARSYLCIGYGFNDAHIQPVLVRRVKSEGIPLLVASRSLTASIRRLFLQHPPKRFLFLEQAPQGTNAYHQFSPEGELLKGHDCWQLDALMEMITAEKRGKK